MKILLTGASGFLGSIIKKILEKKIELISLSRSEDSDISADITKKLPSIPLVDMVVHAAGKAHVIPKNNEQKNEFFEINYEGTQRLLNKISGKGGVLPEAFVFISTVAVYGRENGQLINEDTELLGHTPYAKSKIKAEKAVREWGEEHGVNTIVLRLPLVAGPNPPGNLGSMIAAIEKGYYFRIGTGKARRSVVLAKDVGQLIPDLIDKQGIFNLTDGYHPTLAELDAYLADQLAANVKIMPSKMAKYLAKVGDYIPYAPFNSYKFEKLTKTLTFSDKKAQDELGWSPNEVVNNFKII